MLKAKAMKVIKHNAAAAAVRTPKFRPHVIPNKKRDAARRACRGKGV